MSTVTIQSPPAPIAPLMTADEFCFKHGGDYVELIMGVVQELPVPYPKHGLVCSEMAFHLMSYVKAHDIGRVMSNDSFVQTQRGPDTVRGADIGYWSYERLPKGAIPDGLLASPPDLVIEVRSPSDRWTKVIEKMLEYLNAGVRVVIVLDPKTATACVYRPDELQQIFDNGDDLTISDVLPGFSVPVKRLFE